MRADSTPAAASIAAGRPDEFVAPGGVDPARTWVVCTLLFGATALCYLDRQVLSVLAPQITAEFGMSNTAYSRVLFAFVLSYTVMLALGGGLMDRLGTRLGLGLSVGLWSVVSAAHAFVVGPWSLGVARFFLGVTEGPCFPGTTKGAVEAADPRRRGLAVGFANSGSAFGAIVAPPLTAWATGLIGWRATFGATALLGLGWVVAWRFVAGRPATRRKGAPVAETGTTAAAAPMASFGALLGRPAVQRLMAARFFFDPVFYFYLFWIPQYLAQQRGMSLAQIGARMWIPFVALEISNIGAGHISDLLIRRGWPRRRARMTLMLMAALLTPASFLAALAGTPGVAIGLMAVLLFAHGIWISNYMTLVGDTVAPHEVATTVGLTGTCGGIAGMLSNLIIGPVVDAFNFTPVFLATAFLYPIAWLVLRLDRTSLSSHQHV